MAVVEGVGRATAFGARVALVLVSCIAALSACNRDSAHDLTTEQLSQVVAVKQPGLQSCYEVALIKTPYRQEMKMAAVLDIAPDGHVASVELEGGGGLPGLNKCITGEIKSWKFPVAQDPTATKLPLIFRPEVRQQRGPDIEAFKKIMQGTEPLTQP